MKVLPWIGGAAALAAAMSAQAAETPTVEELWQLVQQQQAQIEALQAELRSTRTAVAQTDEQIEQVIRARADTIYHPVGSCRMGPDPAHDVVDAQLRVHGLQGLRVVDASIMPRIVSGNTNAPVIMVAEKAADLLKAA